MKSNHFVAFGVGTGIAALGLQIIPAAIIAAGCFIAAGLYRIAEK